MLRYLIAPFSLFLVLGACAQTAVRIVSPAALVARPDLAMDAAAQAGLKAAGISSEGIADVLRLSDPRAWPVGLRTDSARSANAAALVNFNAYLVCEYADDEGAMTIISLPSAINFHMPDDLRAKEDFYLVLRAGGVEAVDATALREPPSKGPSWQRLRPARILRPDAVFATYDLGDDADALAALDKQGLSKAEIDAVVFRSHERNWPEGIESFEKRYPKLKLFRKYKAFRLARWADKVLVVIPAEANKRAPESIRPRIDVYMVFYHEAVKEKR
ncbi:MAG TPA: hypothetical protein PKY96_08785 [Flavobacteriales bacterium]|nr:hypothetical protein [Flavobacteriales bacterium]